jgi:tetratricopeptide (TPR) repeat protein
MDMGKTRRIAMESTKGSNLEVIMRKLNECKKHLQLGRIYACLLEFSDLLEKSLSVSLIAADEKHIVEEINVFQKQLQGSKSFKDVFGPVTFQDSARETTLAFIKQLIVVEEEEILTSQDSQNSGAGQKTDADDIERLVQKIILLIDRGDIEKARILYADNEMLRSLIIRQYNRSGIGYRKEKRYADAIGEFKKALTVEPEDECLYYNESRAHIEKGDWAAAKESITEALKINSGFKEGQDLLHFIQRQHPAQHEGDMPFSPDSQKADQGKQENS